MQISRINNDLNINNSFSPKNKNISFAKLHNYYDMFEYESAPEYEEEKQPLDIKSFIYDFKKTASDIYNGTKTSLWLSLPSPTKLSMRAYMKDPEAFTYEEYRNNTGKVINKEVLSEIDLARRKSKNTEKAVLRKVEFDDLTTVYLIQKKLDKLAYFDVDLSEPDIIYVNYATTIVGREQYRNLFMTLMQAIVEDYVVKYHSIPSIEAEAAQVGNMDFNRASLYKFYGAESEKRHDDDYVYDFITVSKDKVYELLKSISDSPKRNFILPKTASIFDEIKSKKEK